LRKHAGENPKSGHEFDLAHCGSLWSVSLLLLVYIISVIGSCKGTTTGTALAAIAPHLKEAALRLATYFAAAAEHQPNHTISPTRDDITKNTGLVRSAIARAAVRQLCDPGPNYVTTRAGGTRTPKRTKAPRVHTPPPIHRAPASRLAKNKQQEASEKRQAVVAAAKAQTEAEIPAARPAPGKVGHAPDTELIAELRGLLARYTLGTVVDATWEASRKIEAPQ